mmetsp:Transcript_25000/g.42744  ORF Transcript_25000/g.42744 Transcript_25000/m.42744 type:complete len:126 (-) Transcript_25000:56-433(-)
MTTSSSKFKASHPKEKREELANKIRNKYPDRIPVIVERGKNVPDIIKQKFLVPGDLTVGKFTLEIKKHLIVDKVDNIDSSKAIFLFVNGKSLTKSSDKLSSVYEQHRDQDGFVYITYHGESTYGC